VLLALLVDGRARVPHLRVALDRASRHRRDQRADDRLGQEHRLVERDEVAGQTSAAAAGPRLEEDPLPAAQLDRLGALALRRLQHPALELRHALDQRQQPAEVLGGCRLLVRRVDQQLLAQQEQAGQLARLEDRALAVLARDYQPDLERRPLAVRPLAERVRQDELLPGVEVRSASCASSIASSPADETYSGQ
jgi:hypothetical protein